MLAGHGDERAVRRKPCLAARDGHADELILRQIVENMRLGFKAHDLDVKSFVSQSALHHGCNPSLNKFKPLSAPFC